MKLLCITFFCAAALLLTACNNNSSHKNGADSSTAFSAGQFGYDLAFLKQHDSIIVLKTGEDAQVIVSPKYQAKVFTSTATGPAGKSFGWINYKAFASPVDPHMNAYGGENRFWLGPEGGVYSLFFAKGKPMEFANWKTPAPIDTASWQVVATSSRAVTMQKPMKLVNYRGTTLRLLAQRSVEILPPANIKSLTGIDIDTTVGMVGYRTANSITNTGNQAWTEATGMPCIWQLDMFAPSPKTVIIIPYKIPTGDTAAKIATTDYFGEIPADRIKYNNGVLLFVADGKSRGKLGLSPKRAMPVAGSYDATNHILTITLFDVDARGRYLNQEWNTRKHPFSGDAVNAYNDGPLEDGSQMGPFYEIESVSPAAFLKPAGSLTHHHTVLHFTGNTAMLDKIAVKMLGISLAEVEKAFDK